VTPPWRRAWGLVLAAVPCWAATLPAQGPASARAYLLNVAIWSD
jgi:hypothetical protein